MKLFSLKQTDNSLKIQPLPVLPQDVLQHIFDAYLPIQALRKASLVCKQYKKIADYALTLRAKEYGSPPGEETKYLPALFKTIKWMFDAKIIEKNLISNNTIKNYFFKLKFEISDHTLLVISEQCLEKIHSIYANTTLYSNPNVRCLHSLLLNRYPKIKLNHVNQHTISGSSVFLAIEKADTLALELLLTTQANPNIQDPDSGNTPILAAIEKQQPDMVRLLLQSKADLRIPNHYGELPIHLAAGFSLEILKLLLPHMKDISIDVKTGHGNGDTALFIAAERNKPEIVSFLQQHGASFDVRDTEGFTPLTLAANYERTQLVQLLLDYHANPNFSHKNGKPPLHFAVECGNTQIIEILLQNKAKIDALGSNGDTALSFAAKSLQFQAMILLLENKADPNLQNSDGDTPLLIMIQYFRQELICIDAIYCMICILVVQHKADLKIANHKAETPLSLLSQVFTLRNKSKVESLQKLLLKYSQ